MLAHLPVDPQPPYGVAAVAIRIADPMAAMRIAASTAASSNDDQPGRRVSIGHVAMMDAVDRIERPGSGSGSIGPIRMTAVLDMGGVECVW